MDEFDDVLKICDGAEHLVLIRLNCPVQQRPNSNWWSSDVTIPETLEGFLLRADKVIE